MTEKEAFLAMKLASRLRGICANSYQNSSKYARFSALGVSILALYTAAPLLWFSSHLMAGRRVTPALTRAASLVLTKDGLTPCTQMLGSPPDAGEVRSTDCVMTGFKRWTPGPNWQVQAIGLTFQLPTDGMPLRSLMEKPS